MGSDESHFKVGSDGQSHKTVSTNHNLVEEKGEPKRYRTEVLPLTSLTLTQHAKRPAELPYLSGLNLTWCLTSTELTLSRGLISDGAEKGGRGGGRGEGGPGQYVGSGREGRLYTSVSSRHTVTTTAE